MERNDDFITGKIIKSLTHRTSTDEYARRIEELAAKYRPKEIRRYKEGSCVVRVYESVK